MPRKTYKHKPHTEETKIEKLSPYWAVRYDGFGRNANPVIPVDIIEKINEIIDYLNANHN